MLLICLMSFSLGISSLWAVQPIEDIHGNIVFVYTEAEHQNVMVALEEVKQWRQFYPLYVADYQTIMDSTEIWKTNYAKVAAENQDLKVQRNIMFGITGSLTISGIVTVVLISIFKK